MSRIFLDTNCILDLFIVRIPEVHGALVRILDALEDDDVLIVCPPSLKDVSYLVENGRPFKEVYPSRSERRALAFELRSFVIKHCLVQPVDEKVTRMAHNDRNEEDFDDALVAACAAAAKADVIITSDATAFANAKVPRMTPKEYAQYLSATRTLSKKRRQRQ